MLYSWNWDMPVSFQLHIDHIHTPLSPQKSDMAFWNFGVGHLFPFWPYMFFYFTQIWSFALFQTFFLYYKGVSRPLWQENQNLQGWLEWWVHLWPFSGLLHWKMVFLNQVTRTLHKNVVSGHINLYLANSFISISHQLHHKNGLKMFPYPKWNMPNSLNFTRRHSLLLWVPRKFIHYIVPQLGIIYSVSSIPNTRSHAMVPQWHAWGV